MLGEAVLEVTTDDDRHLAAFRPTRGRPRLVDVDRAADVTPPDANIDLYAQHGIDLVFATEIIERTDWHGSTSDSYGSTNPDSGYGHSFANRPGRYEVGSMHEVDVQSAASVTDLVGVSADSYHRSELLKIAAEQGVTQVHGIPIAEFILPSGPASAAILQERAAARFAATKARRATA